MKRLAMVLCMVSLPAWSAWVPYQSSPQTEELYESVALSKDAGRIRLWTLSNYAQPMTSLEAKVYRSDKTLTTIDCTLRRSGAEQVLRFSDLNGQGVLLDTMEVPLRLTSIRPGGTDELLLRALCP